MTESAEKIAEIMTHLGDEVDIEEEDDEEDNEEDVDDVNESSEDEEFSENSDDEKDDYEDENGIDGIDEVDEIENADNDIDEVYDQEETIIISEDKKVPKQKRKKLEAKYCKENKKNLPRHDCLHKTFTLKDLKTLAIAKLVDRKSMDETSAKNLVKEIILSVRKKYGLSTDIADSSNLYARNLLKQYFSEMFYDTYSKIPKKTESKSIEHDSVGNLRDFVCIGFESKEYAEERKIITKEMEQFAIVIETVDGIYTCKKCKESRVLKYQMQTAGGDEGTSVFLSCAKPGCGNKWVMGKNGGN